MSYLKLIEAGVPKEKLGLLAVPLTPLQILLPLVISRYTNGPNPLNFFIKSIPFRLISDIVGAIFVYLTPSFKDENNEYPFYYYILCLLVNSIHSIFTYSMFVSQMAFFAKISDKRIGGTYMTFLNTASNMGILLH
jgi:PAT family acetyl-CoA transporter-like MFS transporter 1